MSFNTQSWLCLILAEAIPLTLFINPYIYLSFHNGTTGGFSHIDVIICCSFTSLHKLESFFLFLLMDPVGGKCSNSFFLIWGICPTLMDGFSSLSPSVAEGFLQ